MYHCYMNLCKINYLNEEKMKSIAKYRKKHFDNKKNGKC